MMTDSAASSIAMRVDVACDRFEAAWRSGQPERIEDLLAGTEGAERSALLRELLLVELELLAARGETPAADAYLLRFANDGEDVHCAFATAARELKQFQASDPACATHSINSLSVDTSEIGQPRPPQQPPTPLPATIGRFRILEVLGEGAFCIVCKAHDPQLDRTVAIKMPRQRALEGEVQRQRFLREARAAAGLSHPNICRVHDVHESRAGESDYIVMELLDGQPLSSLLKQGKLRPWQAVAIARKLASALAEAHAAGIVHRDLKPANIMINRRGEPVIMDFGLARLTTSSDAQLTTSGMIMGSPAYMSPEQARGASDDVSPTTDIYSLGVILYEMLCGQRPFSGTVTEVIGKILHVEPPTVSQLDPGVDAALESVCRQAMAKEPAERYGSMEEFSQALDQYLAAADASRSETPAVSTHAGRRDETRALHGRNRRLAIGVAAVLALLPLGYYYAGTIIRFATNQGELVIETGDPNIEVTVQGPQATIYDRVKQRRFVLTAGQYDVQVREEGEDGLKFATRRFTITRGGKETFHARLELAKTERQRPEPAQTQPATTASTVPMSYQQAAEWVLSIGGKATDATFQLNGNQHLTDADLQRFSALTELRSLYLEDTPITDAGLVHLRDLTKLRTLILTHYSIHDGQRRGQVTDAGLVHLENLKRLEALGLGNQPVTDAGLAHLRQLAKLKDVNLHGTDITNKTMEILERNPEIVFLHLSGTDISDEGLKRLRPLKKLEQLGLATTLVTDAGLQYLDCAGLKALHLDRTAVSDTGLETLARFSKLKTLTLGNTRVTAAGVMKLHAALPQCRIQSSVGNFEPLNDSLDRQAALWTLNSGGFVAIDAGHGPNDVRELKALPTEPFQLIGILEAKDVSDADVARLRGLKHLKWLNLLDQPQLTDATATTVASALPTLEELVLQRTQLTDAGLEAIGRLQNMRKLAVGATAITDAGLGHIGGLNRLAWLDVGRTKITSAGLAHLKGLLRLEDLRLYDTNIDDAGLAHLKGLTNLTWLDLTNTQVSNAGLENLEHLTRLKGLWLNRTLVTAEGVKRLHAALLHCKIESDHGTFEPMSDGMAKFELDFAVDPRAIVTVSGNDYAPAELEQPIPLKPGKHVVTVRQPGLVLSPQEFTVEVGQRRAVRVFEPNRRAAQWTLALGGEVHVLIDGSQRHIKGAADMPAGLFKVTHLSLHRGQFTDDDLAMLQGLTELVQVELASKDISDKGLKHLQGLARLETVNLFSCANITGSGFEHLKDLPNLRNLTLHGTRVDDAGLAHLSEMTTLVGANLIDCPITDAGLEHFVGNSELNYLDLSGTQITDAGLTLLKNFPKLHMLGLARTKATNQGLSNLASLANLTGLGLERTQVTDEGLVHLTGLAKLHHLNLNDSAVTGSGLAQLSQVLALDELWLARTKITDEGLGQLAGSKNWTWLNLDGTQLSDAGLEQLKGCEKLRSLSLGATAISDAGLKHLAGLSSLRDVYVGGAKVTDDGIAQLKQKLPQCNIRR